MRASWQHDRSVVGNSTGLLLEEEKHFSLLSGAAKSPHMTWGDTEATLRNRTRVGTMSEAGWVAEPLRPSPDAMSQCTT